MNIALFVGITIAAIGLLIWDKAKNKDFDSAANELEKQIAEWHRDNDIEEKT